MPGIEQLVIVFLDPRARHVHCDVDDGIIGPDIVAERDVVLPPLLRTPIASVKIDSGPLLARVGAQEPVLTDGGQKRQQGSMGFNHVVIMCGVMVGSKRNLDGLFGFLFSQF